MAVTALTCGVGPRATPGCGHPLAEHTDGMRCRTCGRECGQAPDAPPTDAHDQAHELRLFDTGP